MAGLVPTVLAGRDDHAQPAAHLLGRGPWRLAHARRQAARGDPAALSQQLAKLETALGGQLFDRVNNQLILTDAGRFLLRKAETVLAEMDEAEAGPGGFPAGSPSPHCRRRPGFARAHDRAGSLPAALELVPDLELDLHELAPAEALEQLYGRNLQLALLSSVSLAANRVSFTRIDIARDPYVLATPRGLDLGRIHSPETELSPEHQRILNRSIQFNFGNLHNQRVDEWYRRVLPRHQVAACCRTYELALAMVQARLGVALVPQFSTQLGGQAVYDVDLYAVPELERPIVALIPPQYRRAQPFAVFLDCLKQAADGLTLPTVGPTPPFLDTGRRQAEEPRPMAGLLGTGA